MKILAIDPGNVQSAYVVFDGLDIVNKGKQHNHFIFDAIRHWAPRVDILAIELIGHYGTGMPAGQTVFDTCIAIGEFKREFYARAPQVPYQLIKRATIKTHICGSARAKDGNVITALTDRFGGKGTKKNPGRTYGLAGDTWQAFALAVYVSDMAKVKGMAA